MSSSYVTFNRHGFWANDTDLELWLAFLVNEIGDDVRKDSWLENVRNHWRLQATAGFIGCISCELDRLLSSDWQVQRIREYAKKALQTIEGYGPIIPMQQLPGIIAKDIREYPPEIDTKRILAVGRALLELIGPNR